MLPKPIILAIFAFFAIQQQTLAQTLIQGRIIEKESKLPIAFASVLYYKQALQKGVISDVNGKFEINDYNISSITFSCVGYKPNTIKNLTNVENQNFVI